MKKYDINKQDKENHQTSTFGTAVQLRTGYLGAMKSAEKTWKNETKD